MRAKCSLHLSYFFIRSSPLSAVSCKTANYESPHYVIYFLSLGYKYFPQFVGTEILRAVIMNSTMLWDITPCSLLKVNRRFGCHLFSRWFLVQLIFQPWIWWRHVLPKCRLIFNGQQGAISQKTRLFIFLNNSFSASFAICFMSVSCFTYFSTLENGDRLLRNVRWLSTNHTALYPSRLTLHNHSCEDLRSYTVGEHSSDSIQANFPRPKNIRSYLFSGHTVAFLVEALCYRPEGRRFESWWGGLFQFT
jgi:hypothetical protein